MADGLQPRPYPRAVIAPNASASAFPLHMPKRDPIGQSKSLQSVGVVILDGAGRIVDASGTGYALIHAGKGLRRMEAGLLELDGSAGAMIRRRIAAGKSPEPHEMVLQLPRQDREPLSASLQAVCMDRAAPREGAPRWILMLIDPDRQPRHSMEVIAAELGLTAREAEICALLVAGDGTNQVAKRLSLSIHTVRTHLKRVFAKTGLKSQRDVIRKVLGGGR